MSRPISEDDVCQICGKLVLPKPYYRDLRDLGDGDATRDAWVHQACVYKQSQERVEDGCCPPRDPPDPTVPMVIHLGPGVSWVTVSGICSWATVIWDVDGGTYLD